MCSAGCCGAQSPLCGAGLRVVLGRRDLVASPEPDWPQWRGPRRDGISPATGLLKSWPAEGPRLLWKKSGLGVGWSSPIIVGQRLYITGDVNDELLVFALDLSGQELWRALNGKTWTGSYPGARACCCYSAGKIYHLNAHGRLGVPGSHERQIGLDGRHSRNDSVVRTLPGR